MALERLTADEVLEAVKSFVQGLVVPGSAAAMADLSVEEACGDGRMAEFVAAVLDDIVDGRLNAGELEATTKSMMRLAASCMYDRITTSFAMNLGMIPDA